MTTFGFHIVDVTYRVLDGVPTIFLYGRSETGTQCCVLKEYQPWFYAFGDASVQENIKGLSVEGFKVASVTEVERSYHEKPAKVWKVTVSEPQGVPPISKACRNLGWKTFEYDIPFTRRFLYDKKLSPLSKILVKGEEAPFNSKVPVIKATSIEPSGEETLPLKTLAIDIEAYPVLPINFEENPILMIALKGEGLEKVITWKKFSNAPVFVEFAESEEAMLKRFQKLVEEYSPDVITGYYSDGFDLPYILKRCRKYRIPFDIGLDKTELQLSKTGEAKARIIGIAHVDMLRVVKRLVSRSLQTDSYKLDDVAKELLGEQKLEVSWERLREAWDKHPELLGPFCEYNLHDAKLTYDLFSKLSSMLIELVKIVGVPLFEISRMSFSQLVEVFLLKNASLAGEIAPNKPSTYEEGERLQKRFVGALVYEPKPGLYEMISVFDYRSLYPSIIASHHISPGLLQCACCADNVPGLPFHYCQKRKGFISSIIEDLIARRGRVKLLLKESPDDPLLKARSEVLKVLANSFYGYLGFAPARWYSFECGEATTAYGRYYITKVIERAKKEGFEVLYSDTDSVFLLLGEQSEENAKRFVERVNHELPGLMELDFEGFYPSGLFVSIKTGDAGAKKKYALLDPKGRLKIRGFETVRRNWSPVAKKLQREIIEIILRERDVTKALLRVQDVVESLRSNTTPLEDVIITTQLKKSIERYENVGPHVAAAQRMKDRKQEVNPGTSLRFVIVKGKGKIRDKVRLPDEITQQDYDGEYYVTNQVLPGVERIFAVLGIPEESILKPSGQKTLAGF